MKVGEGTIEAGNAVLAELFDGLAGRATASNGHGLASREVAADMRHLGQEHTITIPLASENGQITATLAEIRDTFTREYKKTFGHEMDEEVEIVSLRATLRTPLPRRAAEHVTVEASDGSGDSTVDAYSFTRARRESFRVVRRSQLEAGAVLEGPAILLEATATTYLDAGFEAQVHESGSLFVTDRGEGRDGPA
jgi:N-methylhydantoinase A